MISTHLHFGDFKSAFELRRLKRTCAPIVETRRRVRTRDASSARLPDTITYNTLIYACASNGEDGKAMEMYSDMLVNGIPLLERTWV